ncbi:GNAT family N-acetyltransferase [Desulfitobacterium chlororespirans]|uniref:Acetyltransferase (GNAT) family protein n=1 Tax=Desulfitobacterium chlororespirans DSM 11544 TaxID=1121395 RepID=A0A1M7SHH1_9FIRM|nr:GNAT family N-acetyltransferase [Desulfitobacterium chlororespirans]SHN57913.1 Acetyltransferase (GNAT) family protein [Desulfitobacterium chlororespirans DSM 11544]
MDIIPASEKHLERVCRLCRSCSAHMFSNQIDQWDEIYPDRKVFLDDIRSESLYLVLDDESGEAIACIVINEEQDPEYKEVSWQYERERIAVIHRLMVHPQYEGRGIARQLIRYVEELAQSRKYEAIRLDVFAKNPKAVSFYHQLGYQIAGKVRFRKGEFLCCEKLLQVHYA